MEGFSEYPQLTTQQYDYLLRGVEEFRVKQDPSGRDFLPTWDVERTLTRIFGFAGWDTRDLKVEIVDTRSAPALTKAGKPMVDAGGREVLRWTVTASATVTLVVKDRYGRELTRRDGVGVWSGTANDRAYGQAVKLAMLGAASIALKRAAKTISDQFGLSLYNSADPMSPVVRGTLVPPDYGSVVELPEVGRLVGDDVDEVDDGDIDDGDDGGGLVPEDPPEDPVRATAVKLVSWLGSKPRSSDELRGVATRAALSDPQVMDVEVDGRQVRQILREAIDAAVKSENATEPDPVSGAGVSVLLACGCDGAELAQSGRHGSGCTRRRARGGAGV